MVDVTLPSGLEHRPVQGRFINVGHRPSSQATGETSESGPAARRLPGHRAARRRLRERPAPVRRRSLGRTPSAIRRGASTRNCPVRDLASPCPIPTLTRLVDNRGGLVAFGNREALRRIGIHLGQVLTDLAAVKQQLADQQHAIDCPPRAGRGEPRLPLWRRGPLRSSPRRRG